MKYFIFFFKKIGGYKIYIFKLHTKYIKSKKIIILVLDFFSIRPIIKKNRKPKKNFNYT